MMDYCKNLWVKFAELRSVQAQAEADLELAQASGELETTKTSLDSFKLANNQMLAEWESSIDILEDGRVIFKSEHELLDELTRRNVVVDEAECLEVENGRVIGLEIYNLNEYCSILHNFLSLKKLKIYSFLLEIDLTHIKDLKDLEELSLFANSKEPINYSTIATLKKMKKLDLSGTNFRDTRDLAGLIKLEELNLTNTEVTDLSDLLLLPFLRKVTISGKILAYSGQREIIEKLMRKSAVTIL